MGSTTLVTDESGDIIEDMSGETMPFGDQENKNIFFTGKQWDEDAELYYFNARWYDPETGRFITEDPVKDGLLWYAYCNNSPMNFTDPTGLETQDDAAAQQEATQRAMAEAYQEHYGSDTGPGYEEHISGDETPEIIPVKAEDFDINLSSRNTALGQAFENRKNGLGFRSNNRIWDYVCSDAGQFAKAGIMGLSNTDWGNSRTGRSVTNSLMEAYRRGRIHLGSKAGLQLLWGNNAHLWVNEEAALDYLSGESSDPLRYWDRSLTYLAHEGSHYNNATRFGAKSSWWHEYEIEGYRISDTLSMELWGHGYWGNKQLKSIHQLDSMLEGQTRKPNGDRYLSWSYSVLPRYSYWKGSAYPFVNYFNTGN